MFSFTLHLKNLLYIIKYFQITPDKRCLRNELLKLRKNSEQETNYFFIKSSQKMTPSVCMNEISNEIIFYQKIACMLNIWKL